MRILKAFMSIAVLLAVTFAPALTTSQPVYAACSGGTCYDGYKTGLPNAPASAANLHSILQIAFGIIGGVALLFVAIGALNFIFSAGDPQDATRAREMIIYALVGLAVAATAEIIVTFVLTKL